MVAMFFQVQPLHPLSHALLIFKDATREGWDAHLRELATRETWSLSECKLHLNYLELEAVFLTITEFQDKIVLISIDNTTVVAYIKEA